MQNSFIFAYDVNQGYGSEQIQVLREDCENMLFDAFYECKMADYLEFKDDYDFANYVESFAQPEWNGYWLEMDADQILEVLGSHALQDLVHDYINDELEYGFMNFVTRKVEEFVANGSKNRILCNYMDFQFEIRPAGLEYKIGNTSYMLDDFLDELGSHLESLQENNVGINIEFEIDGTFYSIK